MSKGQSRPNLQRIPRAIPLPDNNKGTLIKWIIKRFAEDGEKVSE